MARHREPLKWAGSRNIVAIVSSIAFSLLVLNLQSSEPIWDFVHPQNSEGWSMVDTSGGHIGKQPGSLYTAKLRRGQSSLEKGYMMCAGNDKPMVASAMYKIKELRTIWNSTLPITIAHCHELSRKTIANIRRIHEQSISQLLQSNEGRRPLLDIMDLCIDAPKEKKLRLRGVFCKPAALVMSAYTETMLIDTDSIWFKNPDSLFNAPMYKDTGALFFRDRAIRYNKDNTGQKGVVHLEQVKKFAQEQSTILKLKIPLGRL